MEPDKDYENPIGEVLDEDTVNDLRSSDFVSKLGDIFCVAADAALDVALGALEAVIDAWPSI